MQEPEDDELCRWLFVSSASMRDARVALAAAFVAAVGSG